MSSRDLVIGVSSICAAVDSVAISLKNEGPLDQVCGEKSRITRLVEAANRLPGLACHIHILRMAVGAAILAEFGLEDIQECGLLSVRIAGLLAW